MTWPSLNEDPWGEEFLAQAVAVESTANEALVKANQAVADLPGVSDQANAAATDAAAAVVTANAAQTAANAAVTSANAAQTAANAAQTTANAALSRDIADKYWARNPDQLIVGAITRDANGAASSAAVKWPDGTAGVYTTLAFSVAFPGAVDGYKITYGTPATKTYTQPTLTRNAAGAVTDLPEIVVT